VYRPVVKIMLLKGAINDKLGINYDKHEKPQVTDYIF